jgi:hypothetical protein
MTSIPSGGSAKKETPEWEKFSKMFNWVARSRVLSSFEKLLYTRIHGHLGEHNEAWPGMRTLANELGASKSQVAKGLQRLEALKLIAVFRTSKHGPKKGVNYYSFTDHPMKYEALVESEGYSEVSPRQVHRVPPAGPPCTPGRYTGVPLAGTEETHSRDSVETQKEIQFAGSLRSPEGVSLRSPSRTGSNLTKDQIPAFEITSPKWTDAAGAMVLPQPPAQAISPESFSEWNMTLDTAELRKRLEGLKATEEGAKAKNRAAVGVREQRRAAKEHKLKNLKGAIVTVGPGSSGSALRRLEALWMEEFTRKFPDALIAKKWEGKERGQMKGLIGLYSEEDVARAVRYYVRYWDNHRPRFFKGTAALPNVGQLRAAHAQIVPEAKQMSQALQVQAEYKKWSADNRMTALPPPKALQEAYDKVKSDLKTLGF